MGGEIIVLELERPERLGALGQRVLLGHGQLALFLGRRRAHGGLDNSLPRHRLDGISASGHRRRCGRASIGRQRVLLVDGLEGMTLQLGRSDGALDAGEVTCYQTDRLLVAHHIPQTVGGHDDEAQLAVRARARLSHPTPFHRRGGSDVRRRLEAAGRSSRRRTAARQEGIVETALELAVPLVARISKGARGLEAAEHAAALDDVFRLVDGMLGTHATHLVRVSAGLIDRERLDLPLARVLVPVAGDGARVARAGDVDVVARRVDVGEQRAASRERGEDALVRALLRGGKGGIGGAREDGVCERAEASGAACGAIGLDRAGRGGCEAELVLFEQLDGSVDDLLVEAAEGFCNGTLHDLWVAVETAGDTGRGRGARAATDEGTPELAGHGAFCLCNFGVLASLAEDLVELEGDKGDELLAEERAGVEAGVSVHDGEEAEVAVEAAAGGVGRVGVGGGGGWRGGGGRGAGICDAPVALDNHLCALVLDGVIAGDRVGVVACDETGTLRSIDAGAALVLGETTIDLGVGECGDHLVGRTAGLSLTGRDGEGGARLCGDGEGRRYHEPTAAAEPATPTRSHSLRDCLRDAAVEPEGGGGGGFHWEEPEDDELEEDEAEEAEVDEVVEDGDLRGPEAVVKARVCD
ncbi:hypothetical protein L1887_47141 [Cichorium endivia]|nr:hypothetical protein L1887_47141 [Cichorium endivia]